MPTVSEALKSKHRNEWLIAIYEELQALEARGTWVQVPAPKTKRVMDTKFVLKVKRKPDNTI